MTVLTQYRRLEALGLWREGPDAQRREVVVSLGEATLVVSTPSETALSHWSLPAVERLNPGRTPALYAPGTDAEERLEIEDAEMIAAIEEVRSAIERRRPHPGRLRWLIGAGAGLALLAGAVLWLPGALTRQTAGILPEAKRIEIGDALLSEIGRIAGQPCDGPRVRVALARLSTRVLGAPAPRIVLVPDAIPDTLSLPGGLIVANAALAEEHETPEVLAGYLLAEDLRRAATDPVHRLLDEVGLLPTFRLLTTGDLPEAALRDHAIHLLSRPVAPVPDTALIARFAGAGVSSTPHAYARDATGETVLPLIEADPMRREARTPLLRDEDWLSLQNACVPG
ncbi:MAG: hypothetical protein ACOCYW_04945 [Roseicyclus sp.]